MGINHRYLYFCFSILKDPPLFLLSSSKLFFLLATFQVEKEKVRNETRKETELAIREFYLGEIQRREKETDAKEESYKTQIEKLQEQIKKKKE